MKNKFGFALLAGAACFVAPIAQAQQGPARAYDIASQDLGSAINQLAAASGRQIIVSDELVRGKRAPRLRGRYAPEAALTALLSGSGLRVVMVGNTFVIQRSEEPDQDALGGEILVTGTRIRGRGPVGSETVTIDRKAIDQGGFSTTQQIVQSIPQNFGGGANEGTGELITGIGNGNSARGSGVNLRGLGQASTLVLINGDRPPLGGGGGTFGDLSMIPASLIERVEIVPDGASAIYGSDAVAGVVNIIPRLNFKGAETSFRIGTADGASQEYQLSQLFGARWNGGRLVIAYEFYHRDRLRAGDRAFATDDLRAFGGPDRRGSYASPGTIIAGGVNFAIPTGQNGVGLSPSQLSRGVVNRGDGWYGTDILPEQRRHSAFAAFSQDLVGNVRIYATGLAAWRNYDQATRAQSNARRTVPVTNPYYVDPIGTRLPIGIDYSFARDLGPETQSGQVEAYGATAGLEATFGRWSVDGHATWGREETSWRLGNRVNTAQLALALADTNPATAYNLFGDGASTNPATIEKIRGYTKNDFYGVVWSATLRAEGPLARLPAGEIRLAVGGEYREDRYGYGPTISYTSTLTPTVSPPTPLLDVRRARAAYAELSIPLLGGDATLAGFHRLDLSLAARAEEYSDFGRTTNPKLGLSWQPISGLTLRGSYGKSFRAPSFTELRQDPGSIAIFAYAATDPQAAGGVSNIIVLRGNDPALRPERAATWTLGADLEPGSLPGLKLSATNYNVDYRDRIADPSANIPNFLISRDTYAPILTSSPSAARVAELFASPYYRNFFGIPATATFVAVADARLQNMSVVKQSGLDIDVRYAFDAAGGRSELGVVGTYIFHIRQQLTATAPAFDVVDTVGNPVDLRLRARGIWSKGGFNAALFANYVDGYTNKTVSPSQRVSSWTTFDLNIGYEFGADRGPLSGVRIAVNASNVLDKNPPYVSYLAGSYTAAYDGENANPLGRVVAIQVTKKW